MKIFKDKKSRPWTQSVDGSDIPYPIPANPEQKIQDKLASMYYTDDVIQQFLLKLPFFSFPMWPATEEDMRHITDLSFCVCVWCGKLVRGPGRIYVSFNIVQHPDGGYSIFWRTRLSCCDTVGFHLSQFDTILLAAERLKPVFQKAVEGFDSVDETRCYVCEDALPCDDEICEYLSTKLPGKQTPEDYMLCLLAHFRDLRLDIFSCLCERVCGNYGCHKRMGNVVCKHCRRVAYCSKKCKRQDLAAHIESGCEHFLKIWEW